MSTAAGVRRRSLLLAAALLALACVAMFWEHLSISAWAWLERAPRDVAVVAIADAGTSTPEPAPGTPRPAKSAPALVIGEYRPDRTGLPPGDAPLATQIPELRAAAARGNATAACRLAEIGFQCGTARALRFADIGPPSDAERRQMEDNLRQQFGDVSLGALPQRYRAYARRYLDTMAMSEMDWVTRSREWGERCEGAPDIDAGETLAALRQAALAGEPASMARYASGMWMTEFAAGTLAMGFTQRGPGMDWLRSAGFEQWRRDAVAVRRAGLERGDPEMLHIEFAFSDAAGLFPLAPADPIEGAAALRAYAALIGGHSPESTLSLGLSTRQAEEADRLSDAWADRARERGRQGDVDVAVGRLIARGESACD